MDYETVIGLEVHVQLLTQSKMFCGCSADYANSAPNTHVCPVCMGMPGVLPVINKKAVEYTMLTGMALGCSVSQHTKFDRKNYPYPDLMKGYQISQYDMPICGKGALQFSSNGKSRKVGVTRVHLEEDVAKLTHCTSPEGEAYSLVDVNRSGVPLMEIVGDPDLRSAEDARQYLMKLHAILLYLGVSTGSMEEGSFRCDANISIRASDGSKAFPKVEVKNMNSFKAVFRALEFEEKRQREVAGRGERLAQETRGWVEEKGITVSQRSKEYAHDYRYFPEPDLPPLEIIPAWIEEVRARLPELPEARKERFVSQYGLSEYDAGVLTGSRSLADLCEACVDSYCQTKAPVQKRAKAVANWLLGDFLRLLKEEDPDAVKSRIKPDQMAEFLGLIEDGTVSGPAAKQVFEEMFKTGKPARQIVSQKGLTQISDTSALDDVIKRVVAENPQAVADFAAGKGQAVTFLMGQVMRTTGGRANPKLVSELLRKRLSGKD